MLRATILLSSVILLASSLPGMCQGIPGCFPTKCVPYKSCAPQPRPAPIVRTVRVDVPAPCPPISRCMPAPICAPQSRCLPPCPPPCPTRPVRVRVEVVVKPERRKPCVPQRFCCENPPVFEPIFCSAARILQSVVLAPLGLGQSILGHGVRRVPCPPPTPIACRPCPPPPCPGFAGMCARPAPQYMRHCRPPVPLPMRRPRAACMPFPGAPYPR